MRDCGAPPATPTFHNPIERSCSVRIAKFVVYVWERGVFANSKWVVMVAQHGHTRNPSGVDRGNQIIQLVGLCAVMVVVRIRVL